LIWTQLDYNVANLLNSDDAVAVCQTDGERLKNLVALVRHAGWGVVVVETVAGDHYLIASADRTHEGNLVGNIRKWNREHGYTFLLKRSDERISTPEPNFVVLPGGRMVEILSTHTLASGFTHWGLSVRESLPHPYVRL
jgi:hypothetical protein